MDSRLACGALVLLVACLYAFTSAAAQDFPPFDSVPKVSDGQAVFTFPLVVRSEMLGLSPEIVYGTKLIMGDATGLAEENWHYRRASVVDESESVYFVEFEVVTQMEDASTIEAAAFKFVESGGLASAFEGFGLPGLVFSLGAPGHHGTSIPAPKPEPEPEIAAPREPDNAETIAELLDDIPTLLPNEERSKLMHLYIRSSVLFFHPDLKTAIAWFSGDKTKTLTEPPSWHMVEVAVLNETLGHYIASFAHVGQTGTTDDAVARVEGFVERGALDEFLVESGAANVTVSLLPVLQNIKPQASPAPKDGFASVRILLRVAAPITGVTQDVSDVIVRAGATVTETQPGDWTLTSLAGEVDDATNGPFKANYAVSVTEGRELAAIANMTMHVRTRQMDEELWAMGMTDVKIRARRRLTVIERSGGGGGAIKSSAATAAASVAGMLIVLLAGAAILCLLPRDSNFGQSRSNAALPVDDESKWWNVRS